MPSYTKSRAILANNRKYIPGGIVSVNRVTSPEITFVKGLGAYLWDADGNRYIDYHAAFAPHFLGHNDPHRHSSRQPGVATRSQPVRFGDNSAGRTTSSK